MSDGQNAPIIDRCAQLSEQWIKLRCGLPTASKFHKIVTPKKAELSEMRWKYLYRLVAERLMGTYLPEREDREHMRYWQERGMAMQPIAAEHFERQFMCKLEPIGFVLTADKKFGASPDYLVAGTNEAVEIKCPAPWHMVEYLLTDSTAEEGPRNPWWVNYRPQVQGQLFVGQWDAVHLYCWHPRTPPKYEYTRRDRPYIEILSKELYKFADALDEAEAEAKRLGEFKTDQDVLGESVLDGSDPDGELWEGVGS
jgi:hypothetical protein